MKLTRNLADDNLFGGLRVKSVTCTCRAPDKVQIFISMSISSPNPMLNHLLQSFRRNDSNKWSNIGFDEEITPTEMTEFYFEYLNWCSVYMYGRAI